MINLFKVFMPPSVKEPLLETLFSGYVGQGKKVDEFEAKLADYIGNPYCLTTNSGTSAIQLALRLANVQHGDNVISTPQTCTATNMPILAMGASIKWADIDPCDGNVDVHTIERLIDVDTKAIICVHYGGYPCDLEEINELAYSYGIPVIEDAAHAFGAEYHGKKIGSISDYTCFSFQAIKHLTTVDGGLLVCKHEGDYHRGKLLRWYGIDREDKNRTDFRCETDIVEWGYKYHMNDIAATIGLEQLKYVDGILAKHRENAEYYNNEIEKRSLKRIEKLRYSNERLSSYWLYTILVDERGGFIQFMKDKGVQVSQVHKRNDIHTCFKQFNKGKLCGVKEFSEHQCSIPVHWALTDDDKSYIINKIQEYEQI